MDMNNHLEHKEVVNPNFEATRLFPDLPDKLRIGGFFECSNPQVGEHWELPVRTDHNLPRGEYLVLSNPDTPIHVQSVFDKAAYLVPDNEENRKKYNEIDLFLASGYGDIRVFEEHLLATKEYLGADFARVPLLWNVVDKAGDLDFSFYRPYYETISKLNMIAVPDFCHYGIPNDVKRENFVDRFSNFSVEAVKFLREYFPDSHLRAALFNEVSFWAYMRDTGNWGPFQIQSGDALKSLCAKATIRALSKIWRFDKKFDAIQVDPIMHRIPVDIEDSELVAEVDIFNNHCRWEYLDMLSGKVRPELGGSPSFTKIIGANLYKHAMQTVRRNPEYNPDSPEPAKREKFIADAIEMDDPNRPPFDVLFGAMAERYPHAIISVTEAGSYREHREPYWRSFMQHLNRSLMHGYAVHEVCCAPVVGGFEWGSLEYMSSAPIEIDHYNKPYPELQTVKIILEALRVSDRTIHYNNRKPLHERNQYQTTAAQ